MKERPIIFNGEMVRAILAGRKTQTRRPIKPPNKFAKPYRWTCVKPHPGGGFMATDGDPEKMTVLDDAGFLCPYGVPGDRLWVRETFLYGTYDNYGQGKPVKYRFYKADNWDEKRWESWRTSENKSYPTRIWKPSLHMPRWASRITLEITKVRVERVQEISEEDAEKEGVYAIKGNVHGDLKGPVLLSKYQALWDSIYGNWQANPWVWVIEFKKV